MKKSHILLPTPNSSFIAISCKECESKNIVFSHSTTIVNCVSCGNIIVKPAGSIAKIYGTILKIIDSENKKQIPKMQRVIDSENKKQIPKIQTMKPQTKMQIPKIQTMKPQTALPISQCSLDSMIIHSIINDEPKTINDIIDHSKNKNVEFILLDLILDETINMELDKHNQAYTPEEIFALLENHLEKVDRKEINLFSKEAHEAFKIFESKKYKNTEGEPLSETDCYLLVWSVKNSYEVLTRDSALKFAIKDLGGSFFWPGGDY